MTMSKIIECKYECGTRLGDFDQDAHKYREVATGEIHTWDRCNEAKLNLAAKKSLAQKQTETSKQNEQKLKETVPITETIKTELSKQNEQKLKETKIIPTEPYAENIMKGEYVDHTAQRPSKVKIISGNFQPEVEKEYEEFQIGKNFVWSRAHSHVTKLGHESDHPVLFTIYFWYEEKP